MSQFKVKLLEKGLGTKLRYNSKYQVFFVIIPKEIESYMLNLEYLLKDVMLWPKMTLLRNFLYASIFYFYLQHVFFIWEVILMFFQSAYPITHIHANVFLTVLHFVIKISRFSIFQSIAFALLFKIVIMIEVMWSICILVNMLHYFNGGCMANDFLMLQLFNILVMWPTQKQKKYNEM